MFYRRKFCIVKKEFVEIFNAHFNYTNLPNQLKYGTRFIGRWMKVNNGKLQKIFDIWEYDTYEEYLEIESKIRSDHAHVKRIQDSYQKNGGKERVYKDFVLDVRNEAIESTVK